MLAHADPSQVAGLSRFFKTGPGQYGEGDKFLGIKVPVTRAVVKACWRDVSLADLEECICCEYHEVRLAALLTLVQIFSQAKRRCTGIPQQECIDFYLAHTAYINNWDLVDLSCYPLLGEWLLSKCGDGDRVYTLLAGIDAFLCVGAAAAGLLTVRENVSQCKDLCVLAGLSLALLFGSVIERRYVRFETETVWWAQILKVAVGVALILGIKAGLKPLLALVSSSPVMDGVRYGLVGFIAIAVYPLTFRFLPKKKH